MAVKRALVTGCSSGIGLATARALLDDGWAVVGASRTPPPILHDSFTWEHIDLSFGYRVDSMVWRFETQLDALVHCAAVQGPVGPLSETDPRAWANTVKTNLIGTMHAVRVSLPYLRKSEDGRILLFSGGGAFGPRPDYSAYAASKAGVVALAETLSEELIDTTVTVNCVAPGFVPTPMHDASVLAGRAVPAGDGTEMARAVACVRHLLSGATRGLTGKTVSAVHDDWQAIGPLNVDGLNNSPVWTRSRLPASKSVVLV